MPAQLRLAAVCDRQLGLLVLQAHALAIEPGEEIAVAAGDQAKVLLAEFRQCGFGLRQASLIVLDLATQERLRDVRAGTLVAQRVLDEIIEQGTHDLETLAAIGISIGDGVQRAATVARRIGRLAGIAIDDDAAAQAGNDAIHVAGRTHFGVEIREACDFFQLRPAQHGLANHVDFRGDVLIDADAAVDDATQRRARVDVHTRRRLILVR